MSLAAYVPTIYATPYRSSHQHITVHDDSTQSQPRALPRGSIPRSVMRGCGHHSKRNRDVAVRVWSRFRISRCTTGRATDQFRILLPGYERVEIGEETEERGVTGSVLMDMIERISGHDHGKTQTDDHDPREPSLYSSRSPLASYRPLTPSHGSARASAHQNTLPVDNPVRETSTQCIALPYSLLEHHLPPPCNTQRYPRRTVIPSE